MILPNIPFYVPQKKEWIGNIFFFFCFLRALSYVGYYAERGLQMPLGVKGVSFLYGMIAL